MGSWGHLFKIKVPYKVLLVDTTNANNVSAENQLETILNTTVQLNFRIKG